MNDQGIHRDRPLAAEAILAHVDIPVFVLDSHGTVLDANPAATRLLAGAHDEVVGQSWSAWMPADVAPSDGDPPRPENADGVASQRPIVDRNGQTHRLWWTDSEGPDGTVIRVGMARPRAGPDGAAAAPPDDDRLLNEAKRRVAETEKLRQASAVVLESLDLSEAIRRILEQLAHVIPYDSASVQLLRDGELEIVGGRGWANPDSVIGMRFKIPGDNPNTEIVQQRTPVVLDNALEAYAEFHKPPHDHIRSFLGVPMIVRDRLIGVLSVDSRQPAHFTEDHVRVATAFADQVAIAIENARLYEDVQKLSMTDPLTGLHNRRGLFELGRRELERARRFDHALSLLMLDLDRFKMVNDTHGHGVGDEVLTAIAHRCRDALRDVDILSRYGGEEFAAMLPETSLDDAQRIADRLRRTVDRRPIETEAGPLPITVSVGVAAWDPSVADLEELLADADTALYEAKAAGRNRVRSDTSAL